MPGITASCLESQYIRLVSQQLKMSHVAGNRTRIIIMYEEIPICTENRRLSHSSPHRGDLRTRGDAECTILACVGLIADMDGTCKQGILLLMSADALP